MNQGTTSLHAISPDAMSTSIWSISSQVVVGDWVSLIGRGIEIVLNGLSLQSFIRPVVECDKLSFEHSKLSLHGIKLALHYLN